MEFNFYTPHAAQQEIHNARGARFRTVCCGRRFGKTMLAAAELLDCAALVAPGDYGWIAPTYWTAARGVEALGNIAPGMVTFKGQNPVVGHFDGPLGECRFIFCSTDNPDSIPGLGFQGVVLDECAQIGKRTYDVSIRPTISQTSGWQLAISTPRGRNWFYDLHTKGFECGDPAYRSFIFPSDANPFFPRDEMGLARATLPEDVFRQEYLAEFLEDGAGVFRGVDGCLFSVAPPVPADGLRVVVGVDVAKHTDWTVCIALDAVSGRCLDMERFNQLDWPVQRERITAFAKRWGGRVVMDATGVGDPVYDDLCRVLPSVTGFKITGPSKRGLVQGLMVAVEQRRVSWPAAWEVVTGEMKRYEYEMGPTGQISYNAPSGFHDDCVIALALAVWGAAEFGKPAGNMIRLDAAASGGSRQSVSFGGYRPRGRRLTLV